MWVSGFFREFSAMWGHSWGMCDCVALENLLKVFPLFQLIPRWIIGMLIEWDISYFSPLQHSQIYQKSCRHFLILSLNSLWSTFLHHCFVETVLAKVTNWPSNQTQRLSLAFIHLTLITPLLETFSSISMTSPVWLATSKSLFLFYPPTCWL